MHQTFDLTHERIARRMFDLVSGDTRGLIPGSTWKGYGSQGDQRLTLPALEGVLGGVTLRLDKFNFPRRDGTRFIIHASQPNSSVVRSSVRESLIPIKLSTEGSPLPPHSVAEVDEILGYIELAAGHCSALLTSGGYPVLDGAYYSYRVFRGQSFAGEIRYTGYETGEYGSDWDDAIRYRHFHDLRDTRESAFDVCTDVRGSRELIDATSPDNVRCYQISLADYAMETGGSIPGCAFGGVEVESQSWDVLNTMHDRAVAEFRKGTSIRQIEERLVSFARDRFGLNISIAQ